MSRIGAVPAAAQIEAACDMPFDEASNNAALHELQEAALHDTVHDFEGGFILGLKTARVMVMTGGWSKESILSDLSASESNTTEAPPVLTEAEAAEVAKEGAPTIELG